MQTPSTNTAPRSSTLPPSRSRNGNRPFPYPNASQTEHQRSTLLAEFLRTTQMLTLHPSLQLHFAPFPSTIVQFRRTFILTPDNGWMRFYVSAS
ncbi:hypothetical protein PRIPAC_85997 [Pristionchus pacificus]|uniref:Uncharacterized protein n=1 Tax=Pristionchus pacificus TaxID=54126 RepID=A0A2A6BSH5_PRIPA|nr:hypothetical protein PRIPAC_85997 [Pristionchus pacificus]|eukprot:PDM68776.1 hypothetical protein PRIPAC_47078 [Pristionchus pacificus]